MTGATKYGHQTSTEPALMEPKEGKTTNYLITTVIRIRKKRYKVE